MALTFPFISFNKNTRILFSCFYACTIFVLLKNGFRILVCETYNAETHVAEIFTIKLKVLLDRNSLEFV
jgi:hypothetical protein